MSEDKDTAPRLPLGATRGGNGWGHRGDRDGEFWSPGRLRVIDIKVTEGPGPPGSSNF